MKPVKTSRKPKQWILPVAAGMMAILALVVVLFVPKGTGKENTPIDTTKTAKTGSPAPTVDAVAEYNEGKNLVIYADKLSSEQVSFIRIPGGSRIELLARLGDDGKVKAALGTCQSCNGSPGAYYTQEGSEIKCNNCGLTFPVSVLDSPGGGCHPIMLDEEVVEYEGKDLVVDLPGLAVYEKLFEKVVDH